MKIMNKNNYNMQSNNKIQQQIKENKVDLISELSLIQSKIGMNYFYFGDFSISLILLEEIKTYLEQKNYINREEYAQTLSHLGNYYRFKYQDNQAQDLLRRSLEIRQNLFGINSERVAQSKQSQAHLLMDMRRLSSALVKIQESIEIRREIYGDRHPRLAKCLYLKAEILFKNNQIESSQNHVEQALEINMNTIGLDQVESANCQYLLGQIFAKDRNRVNFEYFYNQAYQVFTKAYGQMHSSIAQLFNSYGQAYMDLHLYQDALPYFEKTVEIYKFLNLDVNMAITLLDLGDCNQKLKLYRTAFNNYQESLKVHLDRYGPNDYVAIKLYKHIDEVYNHLED